MSKFTTEELSKIVQETCMALKIISDSIEQQRKALDTLAQAMELMNNAFYCLINDIPPKEEING